MYSHTGISENARQLQQNLLGKYSRTSMARTPLGHEHMFETGVVRANEC